MQSPGEYDHIGELQHEKEWCTKTGTTPQAGPAITEEEEEEEKPKKRQKRESSVDV